MPNVLYYRLRILFFALAFAAVASSAGCSVPNMESPECQQARSAAKRFYSFHFGSEMRRDQDTLKLRERFLTPELFKALSKMEFDGSDYFTASAEPPKTFKIGACNLVNSGRADMQVQIFWRDDNSTVQDEVYAEMIEMNGSWLVNRVVK